MDKRDKPLFLMVIGVFLCLSISLVSASWFGDFFGKITGKAIDTSSCKNCPDLNNDGIVDSKDSNLLYNCSSVGNCPKSYDLNGDEIVSLIGDIPCMNENIDKKKNEVGICVGCISNCNGKICGEDDGCGGTCQYCADGKICNKGICEEINNLLNCSKCPDLNNDGKTDFADTRLFQDCIYNGINCSSKFDLNGDGMYTIAGDAPCLNCTYNSPGKTCLDGTTYGNCSANKPLYCLAGTLINNCNICGCNFNQTCIPNGGCKINEVPINNYNDFILVHNGSWSGKKIKLVFINWGYANYTSFIEDVNYALFSEDNSLETKYNGFLNSEPYRTYKERFEIYRLNRVLNETEIGCGINNPENPCTFLDIKNFARSPSGLNLHCNNDYDFIDGYYILADCYALITFVNNSDFGSGGGGNDGFWMRDYPDYERSRFLNLMLHEVGHTFGLSDEYGPAYSDLGFDYYSDLDSLNLEYEHTNCDFKPGCPKWCSGEAKKIQRNDECMNFKNKSICNGGGLPCVWLTNSELIEYFGSNCIPSDPAWQGWGREWDSGQDCESGTSCFFGCSGFGWRSTKVSIMGPYIYSPEEWNSFSQNGFEPYNTIQKRIIRNVIERVTNDIKDQNKPLSLPIIRQRMIWDLPELSGFTYEGGWNVLRTDSSVKWDITLRYVNISQRSKFLLEILNNNLDSMNIVPLPNSFLEEEANKGKEVYSDMFLRDVNGNKIFEGTEDTPAGKKRYVLWISEDRFIRGWNGNDEGTIIDNSLFDVLLEKYLEKYPSTYTGAGILTSKDSGINKNNNSKKNNLLSRIIIWFDKIFNKN